MKTAKPVDKKVVDRPEKYTRPAGIRVQSGVRAGFCDCSPYAHYV